MKRRLVLGVILAAILIAGFVHFYAGSEVPPGQPPLQSFTPESVAGIKNAFNAAAGDARVLVLLSPT